MSREFKLTTSIENEDDIRFRLSCKPDMAEYSHTILYDLTFGDVLNLRNEAIRVATTINELVNTDD